MGTCFSNLIDVISHIITDPIETNLTGKRIEAQVSYVSDLGYFLIIIDGKQIMLIDNELLADLQNPQLHPLVEELFHRNDIMVDVITDDGNILTGVILDNPHDAIRYAYLNRYHQNSWNDFRPDDPDPIIVELLEEKGYLRADDDILIDSIPFSPRKLSSIIAEYTEQKDDEYITMENINMENTDIVINIDTIEPPVIKQLIIDALGKSCYHLTPYEEQTNNSDDFYLNDNENHIDLSDLGSDVIVFNTNISPKSNGTDTEESIPKNINTGIISDEISSSIENIELNESYI